MSGGSGSGTEPWASTPPCRSPPSSLANVTSQLALVSHNVANADTPGYVAETATQQSETADGIGLGVVTGPVDA